MRRRAALAALVLLGGLSAGLGAPVAASAAPDDQCEVKPGGEATSFWPQQRLNFARAWSVTRGAGVTIGVVDSGLNWSASGTDTQPQLRRADIRPGLNVVGKGYAPTDLTDCIGHGTAVTSLIVAQPSDSSNFVGIAPAAAIVPIRQSDKDGVGGSDGLARGIVAAIQRGARVVNLSLTVASPTPALEAAVAYAQRKGIVLVAAAGNDGQQQAKPPAYPAAWSPKYDNIIAVSASDSTDVVPKFSDRGSYVSVAAPGVNVPVLSALQGFAVDSGTSYAAPYVAGTAALVIASHKGITAAQVRDRIEATADAPPTDVPSPTYGYGIVNPYLAVTSPVADDPQPLPTPSARRVAAPPLPAAPDRSLQHLALGVAYALLALSVVAVTAATVMRRRRPAQLPPAALDDRDLIRR
ncbi:type VII secretion-associated serine protease mycosin [Jatrophihabitans fulvus]